MTVNLTPLRLAMLRKIAAGDVSRGLGVRRSFDVAAGETGLPSRHGHCDIAVGFLLDAGLARLPSDPHSKARLELTDDGREALHAANQANVGIR